MSKFYVSRRLAQALSLEMPIGDAFGGPAYGEREDVKSVISKFSGPQQDQQSASFVDPLTRRMQSQNTTDPSTATNWANIENSIAAQVGRGDTSEGGSAGAPRYVTLNGTRYYTEQNNPSSVDALNIASNVVSGATGSPRVNIDPSRMSEYGSVLRTDPNDPNYVIGFGQAPDGSGVIPVRFRKDQGPGLGAALALGLGGLALGPALSAYAAGGAGATAGALGTGAMDMGVGGSGILGGGSTAGAVGGAGSALGGAGAIGGAAGGAGVGASGAAGAAGAAGTAAGSGILGQIGSAMSNPLLRSVAGSVISGALGSKSARDALRAQEAGAQMANETQRYMYDTTRADNAPFRDTGVAANNQLATLLGVNQNTQGDPRYGSVMRDITRQDIEADPVYGMGLQFGLDEGRKGLDRVSAASGNMLSGAALKALTRYGNDYATMKGNDAFNRINAGRQQKYNMLAGLSGAGQVATNQVSQAGQNMANNISSNQIGIGTARGASTIAANNSWTNALSKGIDAFNYYDRPRTGLNQNGLDFAANYNPYNYG